MEIKHWLESIHVSLRMIGATPVDCDHCGRTVQPQEWYVNVIRGGGDPRPSANVCRPCWEAHESAYVP